MKPRSDGVRRQLGHEITAVPRPQKKRPDVDVDVDVDVVWMRP